jgi:ribonuclease D
MTSSADQTRPDASLKRTAPSKADSASLPPFSGLSLDQIVVPATQAEFADACSQIRAAGVVGFDTESKPVFDRGRASEGPHVLQFALADRAFIFQSHRRDAWPFFADILQSTSVIKVGFDLKSDRGHIRAKFGVTAEGIVDLNQTFRQQGYRNTTGARAAIALVFNQKFHKSKSVTTSNWSLPVLSPKQLLYAANDAYAAIRVWQALAASEAARV